MPESATVTGKLKQIRNKYRKAISEGRKSGNGRVVAIYYELCEQIWGGSPATQPMSGIETPIPNVSNSQSSENSEDVVETGDELVATTDDIPTADSADSAPDYTQRRALLDDRLRHHKTEKLKRKLSTDQLAAMKEKEELEMKKRMLDKLDELEKKSENQTNLMFATLNRLANSMESLVKHQISQPASQPVPAPYYQMPNYYQQQLPRSSTPYAQGVNNDATDATAVFANTSTSAPSTSQDDTNSAAAMLKSAYANLNNLS